MWRSIASIHGIINELVICLKFPLSLVLQFRLIFVLLRCKYGVINVMKFISVTSYFLLSTMKTDCHCNNRTRRPVKNKSFPCERSNMGRRGRAPFIPNLGGRLRWVVKCTPRSLYQRENSSACWTPLPFWTFWKRGKSTAIAWVRAPDHLARNLVGAPTTLLCLLRAPVISVTLLQCEILKILRCI